jgi:hypothetical protein
LRESPPEHEPSEVIMLAHASWGRVKSAPLPRPTERRQAERHACTLDGFYRPLGTSSAWLWWLAAVRDVSVKGISLSLTRHVEPGTLLSVELQNAAETFKRTLLVRVVWIRAQVDVPGWEIGGAFVSGLSDEDLQALLG